MDGAVITGRRFWKMTGSGNDFVFVDGRADGALEFAQADVIRRICARGTGVGADGLVILKAPESEDADLAIVYYNADGSLASLCGNATLCTARLGVLLGAVDQHGFGLETGSGVVRARVRVTDGVPEFDLPPIDAIQAELAGIPRQGSEQRLGFATAGIPHVVIQVPNVAEADVVDRGRSVRHDRSLADGANVNFVSRFVSRAGVAIGAATEGTTGPWQIRTYERGVEGETLACGTGSVATAVLLREWEEAGDDVELETASGQILGVRLSVSADGRRLASLRGEGRLVFEGAFGDV
jgi:diaminopimelate epimerase